VSKIFIGLAVVAGILIGVAPSQAQTPGTTCPAGQTGVFPYCQVVTPPPPPPPGPVPAACGRTTAKMSLSRATFSRTERTIDILAPISKLASGNVSILLQSAGKRTTFSAPIDSGAGQIAIVKRILASQALLGTGILTISYPGDSDTRSQIIRLRAANNAAKLKVVRPVITPTGFLVARGSVTSKAEGVVRVQIEYFDRTTGETVTLKRAATINASGKWSLNAQLSAGILAQIANRCGTVHSYTQFTGYFPERIRGELRSFEILPSI